MINFKKKNKNKILIILTALVISLIAIIFPFTIKNNNKDMNVMAESSTAPVVTAEWFDFSKPYFANNIDFFASSLKGYAFYQIDYYLYNYNGTNISSSVNFTVYFFENNNLTSLPSSDDQSWFINNSDTGFYIRFIVSNSNDVDKFILSSRFIVVLFNSNSNTYQCLCSPAMTYSYNAYKEAISSDYEDGYDAGHSDGYQEGYQEGYEEGYNSFVEKYSGFGVFNNASLNIFNYVNNKYTEVVNDSSGNSILDVYKTVSNNINYTELECGVNFGSSTRVSSNLSWYNYMRLSVFDNNLDFAGKFVVTPKNLIDLRIFSQFSVDAGGVVVEGAQKVFNGTITFNLNNGQSVDFTNANLTSGLNLSDYSSNSVVSIEFKFNNFSDINDLSLSLSNVNFTIYYEKGFEDGKNSIDKNSIYTNGYNAGHSDGYESGKNYGIIHANEYSFLGLIGAVVDAPIKAFTSLFDFEILGFNISAFIMSLITVCVIITIVKLLLGGK